VSPSFPSKSEGNLQRNSATLLILAESSESAALKSSLASRAENDDLGVSNPGKDVVSECVALTSDLTEKHRVEIHEAALSLVGRFHIRLLIPHRLRHFRKSEFCFDRAAAWSEKLNEIRSVRSRTD
jgi:hypothetical protein